MADQPKLVVLRGMRDRGKSTMARVLVERAAKGGRAVVSADADTSMPADPMLPRFLEHVVHPGDVPEAQMYDWYRELIDAQINASLTMVLDTAGGDHSWPKFKKETDLEAMLAGLEVPIMLTEVLLLGPDKKELEDIFKPENHGVVASKNLIMMLNEGVDPLGRSWEAAFAKMKESLTYKAALAEGAHEVAIPRLRCLDRLNGDNLSFKSAQEKLGPVDRGSVKLWLRNIETNLKNVDNLLP